MVVKVALMVMSDTETHTDRVRVANALTTAYKFKEAGDELDLIFTGAGTKWVVELSDPDHRLNRAFEQVKDEVAGACKASVRRPSASGKRCRPAAYRC